VLDTGQRRLWRGIEEIHLSKLSFNFLLTLVEAAPNLVPHDQLAEAVWGARRVITPENLSQRLRMLRDALGEHAEQPRYIEVVRGQGYRLIPSVERDASAPTTSGGLSPAAFREVPSKSVEHLVGAQPTSRISPAVSHRFRSGLVGISASVVLMAVVVVTIIAFISGRSWRPVHPIQYGFGQSTRVTLERALELDPALSPDGRMIAYAAGAIGRTQIFVRQVAGGAVLNLTRQLSGGHRWPRWSPDGTQIAFLVQSAGSNDTIQVVPALGGVPRVLVRAAYLGGHSWSPDGNEIAYAAGGRIYKQPIAGGEPRFLIEKLEASSPSWSPDGTQIAFVVGNFAFNFGHEALANISPSSIWMVPAAGGAAVAITSDTALNVSPVWAPDSKSILCVSDRGGIRDIYQLFLPAAGSMTPEPRRLSTGLSAHSLDWPVESKSFVYSVFASRVNIWALPIPHSGPVSPERARAITSGNQTIEGMDISADGAWLVFDSNRAGNQDIYKMRTDGGDPIRLTDHPSDDFYPSWSPDGTFVAFHSFRNGNRDVFVVSADGGPAQQLTFGAAQERMPDWAPDGNQIVFWSDETGPIELYVISRPMAGAEWTKPRQLTVDGGGWARWSPDGRWIAYVRFRSDQLAQLAMISPAGGTPVMLELEENVTGSWPAWSSDGSKIFWKARALDGTSSLWSVEVPSGTPVELVRFENLSPTGYDRMEFTVDGSTIYFLLSERESDIWTAELVESKQ
jgi:TolB protein